MGPSSLTNGQTRKVTPRGVLKKNMGLFGSFSRVASCPPPFWEPLVQKKIKGLFCVLGPKEHFWFLQKC